MPRSANQIGDRESQRGRNHSRHPAAPDNDAGRGSPVRQGNWDHGKAESRLSSESYKTALRKRFTPRGNLRSPWAESRAVLPSDASSQGDVLADKRQHPEDEKRLALILRCRRESNLRTWREFLARGYDKAYAFAYGQAVVMPSLDYEPTVFEEELGIRSYASAGIEIPGESCALEGAVKSRLAGYSVYKHRHDRALRQISNPRRSGYARMSLGCPQWANRDRIRAIYQECRERSAAEGVEYHVDHIIPLCGRIVSGLHVECNLRIITAKENLRKKNKMLPGSDDWIMLAR